MLEQVCILRVSIYNFKLISFPFEAQFLNIIEFFVLVQPSNDNVISNEKRNTIYRYIRPYLKNVT